MAKKKDALPPPAPPQTVTFERILEAWIEANPAAPETIALAEAVNAVARAAYGALEAAGMLVLAG